jgi:dolichol-phosphate mannosyltransferase
VDISLVIPTFNERTNVVPLLDELQSALGSTAWEAVFVDDSSDGTDDVIRQLADADPHVRMLHREENRGGLAGAVVDGMAWAQGDFICVIDADLQHPPAHVPAMLEAASRTGADLVIASRYVPGGSTAGLEGPLRYVVSRSLRSLARLLFPRRLARITDPLGGYFLVRRSIVEGAALRPIGYKILLEILVRCRWRQADELPYRFEPRLSGASKSNLQQGLRFLRHLALLAWDCSPLFAVPRMLTGSRWGRELRPTTVTPAR